jgi:hypothetical protein
VEQIMKYTLTTAALVLAMTVAADAADPTVWQGEMFVSTATPQCTSAGIIVGDSYRAIFAPKGLPDSPTSDQIAFFFPRATAQIVPKSGTLNGAKSVTVTAILPSASLWTESPTGHSYTVSPTTIKATTPSVTITATMSKFWLSGCSTTLSGNLSRRPGNLQF